MDLLNKIVGGLIGSRWGLTAVLGAATGLVGAGVVAFDSTEGKAAGAGAIGLVVLGVTTLGAAALKKWGGGQPPATGAVA